MPSVSHLSAVMASRPKKLKRFALDDLLTRKKPLPGSSKLSNDESQDADRGITQLDFVFLFGHVLNIVFFCRSSIFFSGSSKPEIMIIPYDGRHTIAQCVMSGIQRHLPGEFNKAVQNLHAWFADPESGSHRYSEFVKFSKNSFGNAALPSLKMAEKIYNNLSTLGATNSRFELLEFFGSLDSLRCESRSAVSVYVSVAFHLRDGQCCQGSQNPHREIAVFGRYEPTNYNCSR